MFHAVGFARLVSRGAGTIGVPGFMSVPLDGSAASLLRDVNSPWETRLSIARQWLTEAREKGLESTCKAACTIGYRQIIEQVELPEGEAIWEEAWNAARRIRSRIPRYRWHGSVALGWAYKRILVDHDVDGAVPLFESVRSWGLRTKCDTIVNAVRACAWLGLDCFLRGKEQPSWYALAHRCFQRGVADIRFVPDAERINNLRAAVDALNLVHTVSHERTIPEYELLWPFNRCVMATKSLRAATTRP